MGFLPLVFLNKFETSALPGYATSAYINWSLKNSNYFDESTAFFFPNPVRSKSINRHICDSYVKSRFQFFIKKFFTRKFFIRNQNFNSKFLRDFFDSIDLSLLQTDSS